MFQCRPKVLAVALATAFPMLLSNTARAAEDGNVLDEVSVKDNKIVPLPASGSVGEAGLLPLRSTTSDSASLLRDIPGISLQGAGGTSSLPVIHGLADDRNRIKVDGMDLIASCPNHMNPPLSYIDPSAVNSLKVYAGIAPVSVGGDSIGGTVVVKSREPRFAKSGEGLLATGELGTFYRSNNEARGVNAAVTLANEHLSVTYEGSAAQADNYRAARDFKSYTGTGQAGRDLSRKEAGSSAYKNENHALGVALRNENHLFEAKFGWQDTPYQYYPNQRMDMTDNQQNRVNLRYLGLFDWGNLEARAYRETVKHKMDFGPDKRFWYGAASNVGINGAPCLPISATCAAGMPMDSQGKTSGASLLASIDLSQQDVLRLGGDTQHYQLNDWWPPSGSGMWPGTFWNIKDGKRERRAVFAEWEGRFSSRWMSLVGARYERVKSDAGNVRGYDVTAAAMGRQAADATAFNSSAHVRGDDNFDFTALVRYTPANTLDVEFGYAHKVRSPNLYERYTWSTWSMAAVMNNYAGDGNGYVGNQDLKPEKANTASATFDLHAADRSWEFKATPYYTLVSDYIDAVRCPVNGTTCTLANATTANQFVVLQLANQSARLYGFDLSGRLPLARTELGEFGLQGLLNYTRGKNRDTGDDLYNIMPLNAKLALTQKAGGWDNSLEVVGVSAKNRLSDVRNEVRTPGYSLVNLRGAYSWNQVRVDFGVENVFNRFYYLPLGGAYLGQGRTMSINPPATDGMVSWGNPVPGMGRSFYAGVNVKF